MRLLFNAVCLLLFGFSSGIAQAPVESEHAFDKKYKERIKKDYIYGVYIPEDLADVFQQLNKLIDKDSKKSFKSVSETVAVRKLHFSLGRWMIYNWGFYEGSRLSDQLKKMGVHHPDDMASLIIITYHRYLNKQDLEVKTLVEEFQAKQAAEKKARQERGTVIHEETRKRPQNKE